MKKVNKDPFSNGTEHMTFEAHNCDICVKASHLKKDGTYSNCTKDNMPRCSVQRDIIRRMLTDEPINERTVTICREFCLYGSPCPMRQTVSKRRPKKVKEQIEMNFNEEGGER